MGCKEYDIYDKNNNNSARPAGLVESALVLKYFAYHLILGAEELSDFIPVVLAVTANLGLPLVCGDCRNIQ